MEKQKFSDTLYMGLSYRNKTVGTKRHEGVPLARAGRIALGSSAPARSDAKNRG